MGCVVLLTQAAHERVKSSLSFVITQEECLGVISDAHEWVKSSLSFVGIQRQVSAQQASPQEVSAGVSVQETNAL